MLELRLDLLDLFPGIHQPSERNEHLGGTYKQRNTALIPE